MTGRDLSSMDSGKVCITRDDAIDAIGSLELRVDRLRESAAMYREEGYADMAERREADAKHYEGVIARFREAMK